MASQYAIEASPLDQVAYGTHPIPSRHALLDRAVTLTRRTTVQPRRPTVEGQETNHRIDPEQGYGHALDNRDDLQQISAAAGSASQPDPHSRQRVLELRAARLSQTQPPSLREEEKNTTFNHQRRSTPLISNAFRDSVASDISFNSISGADERLSMIGDSPYQIQEDWPENPNRIAEAVRSLSLRRRQSIDTVRSSEFGEGGRWDRAWGGSEPDEDEDEDDRDDRDGTGAFQRYASTVVDIDGNTGNAWGPLNHIVQGQWPAQSNNLQIQAASSSRQLPPLQNASGVEHVVSLMPTAPPYRRILHSERGEPSSGQLLAQQNGLQRRDTVKSMMGDMGRVSPTLSRHRYDNSSATIGQTVDDDDRSTISNASTSNAHVCVWPPTPAASEHGDSNEGQSYNSRDTLRAYTNGPAMAQRVRVEYAPPEIKEQEHRSPVMATPAQPLSPSAALALPLTSPILEPDGTTTEKTAGSWSRHPAGKPPPQPPYSQGSGPHLERYSDPNKALPSSTFGELGRARRKAIEEHDGRESLVSDLDVETLRLDGSSGSGGSEDWDSRRGSTSTIGSFSSERIREQRQRRSLANSDMISSEKRSSAGTIREAPQVQDFSRDPSHRSWNGESAASTGKMSNPSRSRVIGPPRRSNTGPDSYQAKPRENGYAAQAPSSNLSPRPPPATQGQSWSTPRTDAPPSSVTFSTPKPDRASSKGGSVIVKGATTNSQAEQFLTLAISHHESGDLSRSAYYFERSAKVEGGCIVGMCMWGMALREGWGVRKDQKKGFDWISRAAAKAGDMMSGKQGTAAKSDAELKATRSELKLSVYELGKCFCYGWGVKMDKPMALEYFELAAKLGDSDAQAEAGALLAAGKGCKKDLKKAAMYYRMAEAQGYDTVGLSWIHKDKYDPIASK